MRAQPPAPSSFKAGRVGFPQLSPARQEGPLGLHISPHGPGCLGLSEGSGDVLTMLVPAPSTASVPWSSEAAGNLGNHRCHFRGAAVLQCAKHHSRHTWCTYAALMQPYVLVPAASRDSPARAHHNSSAMAPETPWMVAKHPSLTEEQSPRTEQGQQLLTPLQRLCCSPHSVSLLPMELLRAGGCVHQDPGRPLLPPAPSSPFQWKSQRTSAGCRAGDRLS